jgi:putative tricarboxylic transport membrane protein
MRLYIVPAVIALASVLVIWASLQLELSPPMIVGDSMQPRVFPIFLMVTNLVLIAVLTLQIHRTPPAPIALESFPTWASMGLLAVFYGLTTLTDMFIAISVVMFLMCLLWGERRVHVAIATALVPPFAIFLLFDMVLRIRFPRGILMNWYYG